jgi:hypothetical protein
MFFFLLLFPKLFHSINYHMGNTCLSFVINSTTVIFFPKWLRAKLTPWSTDTAIERHTGNNLSKLIECNCMYLYPTHWYVSNMTPFIRGVSAIKLTHCVQKRGTAVFKHVFQHIKCLSQATTFYDLSHTYENKVIFQPVRNACIHFLLISLYQNK